jgi:ubiquitin-protein ligase
MSCDRRLLKDLKVIHKSNNPLFNVALSEKSMREWHINFFPNATSQFGIIAVHVIFAFCDEYPLYPPKARFLSDVRFKFGMQYDDGSLCLSMLERTSHSGLPSEAWSASYSMHDVLLNIYSILFNPEDHTIEERIALRQAAEATSCTCGHHGSANANWHPQPTAMHDTKALETSVTAPDTIGIATCDGTVTDAELVKVRCSIQCYTLRCTLDEMLADPNSSAIFGFGLVVNSNSADGGLAITSPCEYISYEAWLNGLATSIYNEPLGYFLPLYLTPEHYQRAKSIVDDLFESILAEELNIPSSEIRQRVLTNIMAHLVSCTLQTTRSVEPRNSSMMLSNKIVEGFFQLWRLGKHLYDTDSILRETLSLRISRFLQSPDARDNWHEHSLEEMYAAMILAGYRWDGCRDALIEEEGVRQLWLLEDQDLIPSTSLLEEPGLLSRWNASFETNWASRKFKIFAKYFLAYVFRRAEPAAVLYSADVRFGIPAPDLVESVLQACIQASQLATWREYFEWMEYDCLTEEATLEYLENCLQVGSARSLARAEPRRSGSAPLVRSPPSRDAEEQMAARGRVRGRGLLTTLSGRQEAAQQVHRRDDAGFDLGSPQPQG